MASARDLLKAKRQEARVSHPLAAYSSTGQLRCTACGTTVKHASSWEGHVGSKGHRVNAAKLREVQRKEAKVADSGKRKAELDADNGEDIEHEETSVKKRKVEHADTQPTSVEAGPPPASRFPADFFTDPSQAPPLVTSDDEGEEVEARTVQPTAAQAVPMSSALDAEWESFQQTVLSAPDDKHETYERATVFAEPVLAPDVPQGFPPRDDEDKEIDAEAAPPTEAEIRQRKEQEERELIMDRLMEEERAQEEADAKVSMLKQRLERLRKQRQAAKEAKASKS